VLLRGFACAFLVGCGSRTGLSSLRVDGGLSEPDATPPTACARTVLSDSAAATRFALDDRFVYFAETTGRIVRISKSGGAVEPIANERIGVLNLVVDSAWLYWSSPTTFELTRVLKAGGGRTVFACEGVQSGPKGTFNFPCFPMLPPRSLLVAVAGPSAFLAVPGVFPTSSDRVITMPKDGGDAHEFGRGVALDFAADDSRLYWTTDRALYGSTLDGSQTFFVSGPKVEALAIDYNRVYWTRWLGYDYDVVAISKGGGDDVTEILKPVKGPALAVDDEFVYTASSAGIQRTSKNGRGATLLEPNVAPTRLAVDDCLYYLAPITTDRFRLVRTPK
jgi:hypothetical protein